MFDVNEAAKGKYRRVEGSNRTMAVGAVGRRRRRHRLSRRPWSRAGVCPRCLGAGRFVRNRYSSWLTRNAAGLVEGVAGTTTTPTTPSFVPIVSEEPFQLAATVQRATSAAPGDRGQTCRCGGAGLVRHG